MARAASVVDMLANSPLFGILEPASRAVLADQMHAVVLTPGQLLFSRGDKGKDVFLVLEGRVRISVLALDGRELSFAHATPGDVFGEIAALDGAPRSADATAITHVRLKALPNEALHRLLASQSPIALAVIKLLCNRLRDVSDHFEAIALYPVEVRLARLLLDRLAERPEASASAMEPLALEMSQTELALLIGSTRQRANAALTRFEEVGAVRRVGDRLQCDISALHKLAIRE